MYQVNDIVVYRRNVCRVVGKVRSDMTGEQCYILEPYETSDGSVRMQVPVANKGGHLRALISREQITELIRSVPSLDTLESKPANMKSQYIALLKGDAIEDLVRIIKTSYKRSQERLNSHKKMASIDGEYLAKAEKYLFNELSVAMDMSYDDSKEYFESALAEEM